MSGTFMDGGGHDHGGHASHGGGGGGDGGGFMDGGGHDHGHHHGHSVHGSGGEGGNFLNHVLGYNNNNGHHSFLSHLLGLDHDAHHGGHGGHGADGGHGGDGFQADGGQNPSQTPIWSSALQGMKLSHALEGVNISINGWFFIFYLLCILWLFIVYWIRHHEPLANAVLGRGAAKYETAAADRRIIDNCRDATPIRTSQSQAYYAPMPQQFHDPNAQKAIAAAAFNPSSSSQQYFAGSATPPNTTPPAISTMPAPLAPTPGAGTSDMASFYNQASPYGAPASAPAVVAPQIIQNANGPGHMIATPMPLTPGAQRLKMIINR
ncbi:MAG: hypothetical protein U0103_20075 [Candidatus Obscuribacterales bacterium]